MYRHACHVNVRLIIVNGSGARNSFDIFAQIEGKYINYTIK
jgi:hypothetical protein